jgi:hypothetical protein
MQNCFKTIIFGSSYFSLQQTMQELGNEANYFTNNSEPTKIANSER